MDCIENKEMSDTKYEDMDETRKGCYKILIIFGCIFLSLILLGLAYAAWSIYIVM